MLIFKAISSTRRVIRGSDESRGRDLGIRGRGDPGRWSRVAPNRALTPRHGRLIADAVGDGGDAPRRATASGAGLGRPAQGVHRSDAADSQPYVKAVRDPAPLRPERSGGACATVSGGRASPMPATQTAAAPRWPCAFGDDAPRRFDAPQCPPAKSVWRGGRRAARSAPSSRDACSSAKSNAIDLRWIPSACRHAQPRPAPCRLVSRGGHDRR